MCTLRAGWAVALGVPALSLPGLALLQSWRQAQRCASFSRRALHLPLLQADLYTFFREIYSLWVALGQYAGEPLG